MLDFNDNPLIWHHQNIIQDHCLHQICSYVHLPVSVILKKKEKKKYICVFLQKLTETQ